MMSIRTESDAKYLVNQLKQSFKNATRYSYPDSGDMMELGCCMREIECELSRLPELESKISTLETENARLRIDLASNK